jgi:hypothetical protein
LTDLLVDETDTLSMLLHAPSKVGKSTLGSTAPLPICVFDVEGSWKFIRRNGFCVKGVHNTPKCQCPLLRTRRWDPKREAPPRADGTWDICRVNVRDWETLVYAYMHLTQSPHDFVSIIVDSVTEAQRKLKSQLRGMEGMRIQDWGDLLMHMDTWIRNIRDLTLLPGSTIRFVMFIAETKMLDGKWRPSMQGQIHNALPYWVDICGYLYVGRENDANGQPTVPVRHLFIMSDNAQYEAGERVQGVLGDDIRDPNITLMLRTVFENPTEPLLHTASAATDTITPIPPAHEEVGAAA